MGAATVRSAGATFAASAMRTRRAKRAATTKATDASAAVGPGPRPAITRPAASGPANVPRLSPSMATTFALTSWLGVTASAGKSANWCGAREGADRRLGREGAQGKHRLPGQDRGGREHGRRRRDEVDDGEHPFGTVRGGGVDEQRDDHRRQHPRNTEKTDRPRAPQLVGDQEADHQQRPMGSDAQGPRDLDRTDVRVGERLSECPSCRRETGRLAHRRWCVSHAGILAAAPLAGARLKRSRDGATMERRRLARRRMRTT